MLGFVRLKGTAMREFFKPLRRRIGIVTLALACVFMAGWVRSVSLLEDICIHQDPFVAYRLISGESRIGWISVTANGSGAHLRFPFYNSSSVQNDGLSHFHPGAVQTSGSRFIGFEFGRFIPRGGDRRRPRYYEDVVVMPSWSIVIPLTLVSAWLLLSKPQKPISHSQSTPPANPQ